jgi:hypothetical protein
VCCGVLTVTEVVSLCTVSALIDIQFMHISLHSNKVYLYLLFMFMSMCVTWHCNSVSHHTKIIYCNPNCFRCNRQSDIGLLKPRLISMGRIYRPSKIICNGLRVISLKLAINDNRVWCEKGGAFRRRCPS